MSAGAITCEGCQRFFVPHPARGHVTRCHPCEVEQRQLRASGDARCRRCNAILARHWKGELCGFCRSPGEPVPFSELTREELAAHARRLRPITPELNASAVTVRTPRDSSLGAWGRPRGNRRGATWVDTNCLRACIATMMQWPIERVPDPTRLFRSHGDAWREAFNAQLKASCGIRLEDIPRGGCPPVGRPKWIAVLEAGNVNHAVCANGEGLIFHDPNGEEANGLPVPRDRLLLGLRIVPANAPERDRWGKAIR